MIDQLIQQFQKELASNQFLSGGLILGTATALLVYLKSVPIALWNWIRRKINFEVSIEQDDDLYPFVQLWINDFHKDQLRVVKANYNKHLSEDSLVAENNEKKTNIRSGQVVYNQYGDTFMLWYRGRLLRISSEREKNSHATSSSFYIYERYFISGLFAKTQIIALIDKILSHGKQVEAARKIPCLYRKQWDSWAPVKGTKLRDWETIFINSEKKAWLLKDVTSFISARSFFETRNIPYRRGYLLHGPPGTGKSSLVSALSRKLNRNLYLLNLKSCESESQFENIIASVPPESILLIEDIDRYYNKDQAEVKISYSTFINSISGVKYCEDIILIVTTNHPSKIDQALMRSGRLDVHFEVGYPGAQEANEYLAWFFDCKNLHWFSDPITFSIADLENACVVNRTSIGDAITQVTTNTRLAVNQ